MEHLHGWVFTYNSYENVWYATERDNYTELFSNRLNPKIIKGNNIDTLIGLIIRTKGNIEEMNKFVKSF